MIDKNGLKISSTLFEFINFEVIPNTDVKIDDFWNKFSDIVHELAPANKELIQKREIIQKKVDDWHKENKGKDFNKDEYFNFLKSIGYLIEEKNNFNIETSEVDKEISSIAGPQLVVPVDNARYALNAANARWGSLYDALYGTNVIPEDAGREKGSKYNPVRGAEVIKYASEKLDEFFPLRDSRHESMRQYSVSKGKLVCELEDGSLDGLAHEEGFSGYQGSKEEPSAVLLKHNGLHMEIQIDRQDPIGKNEKGGQTLLNLRFRN